MFRLVNDGSNTSSNVLDIRNISKSFGGLLAVNNVSFKVNEGQIKSLIGPNGAGKTTVINLITRMLTEDSGEICFSGKSIKGINPNDTVIIGLSRIFQNVRLFGLYKLTVLENVMIGMEWMSSNNFPSHGLRLPSVRNIESQTRKTAMEVLEQLDILDICHKPVESLPFGKQRIAGIAVALAAQPKLLLLDEPAAGLNDPERENLLKHLININSRGVTMLLVEHHMDLVMRISDEIVVMDYGEKIAEGTPEQILADKKVKTAYLGHEEGIKSAGNY